MQLRSAWVVAVVVLAGAADVYGCSGGSTNADGGKDAPSDKPIASDVAGPCGASGLACEVCDVSGYAATTMSKPTVMLNACTPTQIADFVTACMAPNGNQQTCEAWQTANADAGACVGCILTQQSAASWGAIVCMPNNCTINGPGCLDLVLNTVSTEISQGGTGSCGDLLNTDYGCQKYACSTCSNAGPPGNTDFLVCVNSAIANECKPYNDLVTSTTGPCAIANGDAAPAKLNDCFPQSYTDVPNFLNIFCGTGP